MAKIPCKRPLGDNSQLQLYTRITWGFFMRIFSQLDPSPRVLGERHIIKVLSVTTKGTQVKIIDLK